MNFLSNLGLLLLGVAAINMSLIVQHKWDEHLTLWEKAIDFQYVEADTRRMEAKHNQWLACMSHPTWNKKQKAEKCYGKGN